MTDALSTRPGNGVRNLTAGVIGVWFLLALAGSLLGVFNNGPRPPIALGLAGLIPIASFVVGYRVSNRFRQFVWSLDLRLLTLTQTWRVVGAVFLVLYAQGALPGVFALPAGLGDVAIGITAPLVAWYWKRPFPRNAFVAWNLLGSLDLVTAVTLGVLASPTRIGVLAGDVSTRLMGEFPLSMIPTFFVPMFLIFHLIALSRISVAKGEE
jgi:hypothetical protein